MSRTGRNQGSDDKVRIDGDRLKEGVDDLLQRDRLGEDKAHAGDKPRPPAPADQKPGWEKADETLDDMHD